MSELRHYRRLWIFVTVVTVLLLGLTVTLNVMHAPKNWGAQLVGGTPPVFVFFCIELISRIPVRSLLGSITRIAASVIVTVLSFAISYQQQMEFIHDLGFEGWVAYVYPVIIDGVVVVATLSLIEVTGKVRELQAALAGEEAPAERRPANPVFQLDEERAKAYREAAAQMRSQSVVGGLNGKATELQTAA